MFVLGGVNPSLVPYTRSIASSSHAYDGDVFSPYKEMYVNVFTKQKLARQYILNSDAYRCSCKGIHNFSIHVPVLSKQFLLRIHLVTSRCLPYLY